MQKSFSALPQDILAADTSFTERKIFDLAYADRSSAQKLDIYWPSTGNGPFPVIISIHGGAFMGGDKRDIQLLPMLTGLKHDYAVIGVNYRLSGEAKFPALVHDVKAAIRWVRANADRFLFDPDRIATWGGSAGGYLSLMMGVSAGVPDLEDLSLGHPDQSSRVQAVVDWFGPTDFLKMDEQLIARGLAPQAGMEHSGPNSPESLLLGVPITQVPALVGAANPETYITADAPPFLLQHGTSDNIVPVDMTLQLALRLRQVLGADKVKLDLLLDAGHADPRFETPDNVKKVLDFLDQHLKR